VSTILIISSIVKRLLWRASPLARGRADFIQGGTRCPCPPPPRLCRRCIADDKLFIKAVRLSDHVLHVLLHTASQRCNLRYCVHSLQLPEHTTQLSDSNL